MQSRVTLIANNIANLYWKLHWRDVIHTWIPSSGIRTKLGSAQRHDKPRWGDFPEKMELPYIENLIKTGGWFDGERPFLHADKRKLDEDIYAPEYFRSHEERFGYLLNRP